jgi:hypothetical protein
MRSAIIEHVAVVHDVYSTEEQEAGWLYSLLPVLLSMLHMQCSHIQSTFSSYPTFVPISLQLTFQISACLAVALCFYLTGVSV